MTTLTQYREKTTELLLNQQQAVAIKEKEEIELDQCTCKLIATQDAQSIAQQVAQTIQQKLHTQISNVVTRCLNAVFDDPYEFVIEFEQKRGKTEAKLVFIRDGMRLSNPLDEVGGGVIDVASLALRLAVILLSKPKRRRLLILDEPCKCVRGDQNKARVREMLLKLSEELGVQFVLCVDIEAYPEFALGKVIEIE